MRFFSIILKIPKSFQILLSSLQCEINNSSKNQYLKNNDYEKVSILISVSFTLQTVARADDDKPIQVTQMPQPAQQFIKQHFADSKVALAKMESDFFYKVMK